MTKKCIILRNSSEVWIPEEKADQLAQALIDGTAPRFVQLTDLDNRIINTADISEFVTQEQMDDKVRIKAGEWQCDQGGWHNKKTRCDCTAVRIKKSNELIKTQRQEEMEKERSPEEQKRLNIIMKKTRAELSKKLGWGISKRR